MLTVSDCLPIVYPALFARATHGADQIGAARIASRLREWNTRYGGLYQPCPYLEDCAVQGRKLADGPVKGPDKSKL